MLNLPDKACCVARRRLHAGAPAVCEHSIRRFTNQHLVGLYITYPAGEKLFRTEALPVIPALALWRKLRVIPGAELHKVWGSF